MEEKRRIVIALENENRLFGLACVFLKHGIAESELELASSEKYIERPEEIDWLVTDLSIYYKIFTPLQGTAFVIGAEKSAANMVALDDQLSPEELYRKMEEYFLRLESGESPAPDFVVEECVPSGPRLYLTCSPEGDSGKTLGSLCLCKHLALQDKKVLYISLEFPQDFGFFFGRDRKMTEEEEASILAGEWTEENLPVVQQGFDYIKPLWKVGEEKIRLKKAYISMIREFISKETYDVIIAEISRDPGEELQELKQMADKVIVFSRQDKQSAFKLSCFLESRDMDADKYLYICNRFDEQKKNYLEDIDITEYVGVIPEATVSSLYDAGAFCMTAEILR